MQPEQNVDRYTDRLLAGPAEFALSVIAGLSQVDKSLPCRYLYDARGSELFEQITRLPEYYLTRTETAILHAHANDLTEGIRDGDVFVEFGSGSSRKTEILLDKINNRITYVPIDVSRSALANATARLSRRYPRLAIHPIVADFAHHIALPDHLRGKQTVGFFPGSTIGNLAPGEAQQLLRNFAKVLGDNARLIVGVDLEKDVGTHTAAYNDAAGVTAAFNLNLLRRLRRELGASLDEDAFRHDAIYNERQHRIEMYLVSTREQSIRILDRQFNLRKNERIHTENSYKYAEGKFRELAQLSGWATVRSWTDPLKYFGVYDLQSAKWRLA